MDAAKKSGVKYLGEDPSLRLNLLFRTESKTFSVFSSAGGAEVNSGVPHFESKRKIEEHLKGSGLDYTFLRPPFIMENLDKNTSSLGFWAAAFQGKAMLSQSQPVHFAL